MMQPFKCAAEKCRDSVRQKLLRFCKDEPEKTCEVVEKPEIPERCCGIAALRKAGKSLRLVGLGLVLAAGILYALFGLKKRRK